MAFHEGFWVVLGTAAPVIVVASAVGIDSTMSSWLALARRPAPRKLTKREKWKIAKSSALRPYWYASLAFLINSYLVYESLSSLREGHSDIPPVLAQILLSASLLLVLSQVVSLSAARRQIDRVTTIRGRS